MTRIVLLLLSLFAFAGGMNAQSTATAPTETPAAAEKPKRAPAFRANSDQIKEAQTKLKAANLFAGEATGKYSDETRAAMGSSHARSGGVVGGSGAGTPASPRSS